MDLILLIIVFSYITNRKGTLEKITDLKGSTFNIEDGKIPGNKT